MKDRPTTIAAFTAGAIAVLAGGIPFKTGMVVAALIGIGIGMLIEERKR
jgi:hypothetical protein